MKNILIVVLILGALVGGFYWVNSYIYNEKQSDEVINTADTKDTSTTQMATYIDETIGFSFDYRQSPDGYVVKEMPSGYNNSEEFVKTIIVRLTKDEALLQGPNVPGEAPPAISINIFKNTEKLWPAVWADKNPMYSNTNTKPGDVIETSVGGAKAVTYSADGLYVMQNFVVTNGDYVFVLTGEQIAEHDRVALDFGQLVESFKFIPNNQ